MNTSVVKKDRVRLVPAEYAAGRKPAPVEAVMELEAGLMNVADEGATVLHNDQRAERMYERGLRDLADAIDMSPEGPAKMALVRALTRLEEALRVDLQDDAWLEAMLDRIHNRTLPNYRRTASRLEKGE